MRSVLARSVGVPIVSTISLIRIFYNSQQRRRQKRAQEKFDNRFTNTDYDVEAGMTLEADGRTIDGFTPERIREMERITGTAPVELGGPYDPFRNYPPYRMNTWEPPRRESKAQRFLSGKPQPPKFRNVDGPPTKTKVRKPVSQIRNELPAHMIPQRGRSLTATRNVRFEPGPWAVVDINDDNDAGPSNPALAKKGSQKTPHNWQYGLPRRSNTDLG